MIIVVLIIVFKPKIDSIQVTERLKGKHLLISLLAFFLLEFMVDL